MNFDRFKNEKPYPKVSASVLDSITEKDTEYINSLQNLKYKSSNKAKILQIVYTTVAVFVAVVAFSLWAIIGRGIRGAQVPSSGGGKEYAVSVNDDNSIKDGLKQLQGFFDDYLTEKPCTLKLTRYDNMGENIDISTSLLSVTTIICSADGSGTMRYSENKGTSDSSEFEDSEVNFEFTKFVMEHNYLQIINSNRNLKVNIDLSGLTNTYENSKRVFDSSKAEHVSIQDGFVVSGEKSLQDFFESYISGLCCGVEVNENTLFFDGDDIYHKSSPSGKDIQCFRIDLDSMGKDESMVYITALVDFGPNGNGFTPPFVSIRKDEIERLKLLYNSRSITVNTGGGHASGTIYNDVKKLIDELKSNPPVVSDTDMPEYTSFKLRLNYYLELLIYENEDGSISDTIRLSYNYFGTQNVNVSEEFVKTVLQILTDVYGADLSVITDEERLKYFDFAQKYRLDYMPNFMEGDDLEITDIKWQIYAYLGFPKELKGEQFDKATNELYGISFDLDKNYNIPLEIGSYRPNNYMKLTGYDYCERGDGKKIVSLGFESYDYQQGYDTMPELAKAISKSGSDTNEFIRSAVGDGTIRNYGEPSHKYTICYYSDDGYTPQQFAYCESWYKDESGQWQSDLTNRDIISYDAEKVRLSFEKWLGKQSDVLEFKTMDFKSASFEDNGKYIITNGWYKIKVKETAKENWLYMGELAEDGWIYGSSKLIICKKAENGEYVYDPNIKEDDVPSLLKKRAWQALSLQLELQDLTLEAHEIHNVEVSDNPDSKTEPYLVTVNYSVKPRNDLLGFNKGLWLEKGGIEGENGWINNITTVCTSSISSIGNMVLVPIE